MFVIPLRQFDVHSLRNIHIFTERNATKWRPNQSLHVKQKLQRATLIAVVRDPRNGYPTFVIGI